MSLANCPQCSKTYNKLPGVKVCAACQKLEDEQFDRVYAYLRDNPGIPIAKLAEDTDVAERLILEWFRTHRLIAKNEDIEWPCERCSVPIHAGRLCRPCSDAFQSKFHAPASRLDPLSDPPSESSLGRRADIGHELRSDKYSR